MTTTTDLPAGTRPRTHLRDDALPAMVGITVALLPFLVPAGPGNTALADVSIAGCLVVAALWVSRERLPVSLPYAAGVSVLMIGGALASTVANSPLSTVLVLGQDALLLLWCAVIALGRHDPAIVAAATVTWCRLTPIYCGVVLLAYVIGFSPLSGVTSQDGVRAAYTFGDPNLAGNYLVASLFLMAACRRPRAASTRRLSYLLVLVAIGFTGSNGAMLTLLIGGTLCLALGQFQRHGLLAGTTTLSIAGGMAAVLLLVVVPRVDFDAVREQAAGSIPLLRDSFGRSGASSSERATILHEGMALFFEGNATGIGPARTKATLEANQAPYVKEAHNDYLATLLERGLVGALGLLLLATAILARCWWLSTGTLPPAFAAVVPRAWLIVVIAPVMAVASGFYEVLHFRHLWAWLGILAALVLAIQDQARAGIDTQPRSRS